MDVISGIDGLHGRDLALLPALAALLRTRNVTRAAEQVALSQPAMSRVLSRLRSVIDDPLLVRSGNCWRLTPRAEQLVEPVYTLLEQAARLYSPSVFDPGTAVRRFHLAIPDVVGASLIPTLYECIAHVAPGCVLEIVPWPSGTSDLERLDVAIASEPAVFPTFRMDPLFDDIDLLVCRDTDPPVPPGEYFERPHVAVVASGFSADLVDRWLAAHGVSRRIAMSVPHYLQALNVVASTNLLAILPRTLVHRFREQLGLVALETGLPQEPDRHWLLHPPRLSRDPANQWLRAQIHKIYDVKVN